MNELIDFLLNYITVIVAAVLLIVIALILILKDKKLSGTLKAPLIVFAILLCLYLAFVVYCVFAFNSGHPIADPVPTIQ